MVIILAVNKISAQNVNNVFAFQSKKKHTIAMNLELDPALSLGITYNRSFDLSIGNFKKRVVGQFGHKTYQFNYNDLNLNFFSKVMNHSKFNAIINVGMENKYLENTVHKANVYNWVVGIMPGYYSENWYLGVEFMLKQLFRVKYKHTDFYKTIYPKVQDGWYSYKNGYLNFSINTGFKFSEVLDLDLRVGYRFTNDFKSYQPYIIPYFGNLAVNYRF